MTLQRGDLPAFESPLLDPYVLPAFRTRVGLIGQQFKQVEHRESMTDSSKSLAGMLANLAEPIVVYHKPISLSPEQSNAHAIALRVAHEAAAERADGNFEQAVELSRKALSMVGIDENLGYVESLEICLTSSRRGLSEAELSQNDLPVLAHLLEVFVVALGDESLVLKSTLERIIIRAETGWTDYGRHLAPVYEALVEIQCRNLGEQHTEIADRLLHYATYCERWGYVESARDPLIRAVDIRRRWFGANFRTDLAYAEALARLGCHYVVQSNFTAAEPELRAALAVVDGLGWEGVVTAQALNDLSIVLLYSGRHAEAEPLLRRALEIELRAPDMKVVMKESAAKLGGLYLFWNRMPDALALLKHAKIQTWGEQELVIPESSESRKTIKDEFTATSNPYQEVLQELSKSFGEQDMCSLARDVLVRKYAWCIPTEEALAAIAKYAPLVEIGAGTGYWAALLRARGVDLIAYDAHPMEKGGSQYTGVGKSWTEIIEGNEENLLNIKDRNLLLCWPPHKVGMASDTLHRFRGKYLLYVGERRSGWTGDDLFFDMLDRDWNLVEEIKITCWRDMTDSLQIYKHKRR